MKKPLHLLTFEKLSIFEQLQLEEALFRVDDRNWCVINQGSSPAIVMGISGKQEELVNADTMLVKPIPLIRRFSGGGTVVVDEQTHFYSLIGNRSILDVPCFPNELLRWTERLYAPAFEGIKFSLRAQDYAIEDKKFGGNAQYISKHRWLHHSSFLWNYDVQMMNYLLLPPKMPDYRNERSHSDFLCSLNHFFSSPQSLQAKMLGALEKEFSIISTSFESIKYLLDVPHRRSTQFEVGV